MNKLLARFAVEGGHVSKSRKKVTPKLFRPRFDEKGELSLSVQRITEMKHLEKTELGKQVVKEHRTAESLYGWAEFSIRLIDEIVENLESGIDSLKVEDDFLPSRHSNLTNWPEEQQDRIDLQNALARCTNSVVFDDKIPVKVPPNGQLTI